ncbi:DUF3108 domain-containing protein [Denitrobaculum tricleocarpae]|uniref:DUF3108 domain-containing protein n=1 Tax=Denitrobaculum tricleocarpae TaxID=2591009 RepID=A0A545T1Z6_9PROT|nr:DUF3108 domain-containing protein [Denitrobaculum tricleocarpae]TQV71248.1 DUF3108 domain-containing protein [Denitrobaculum tricleocarpae]
MPGLKNSHRPQLFAGIFCGAVAALPLTAGSLAADESMQLRYEVAWGNMTLAEAKVNYALNDTRYEIEGSGESQGTLAFLFPWKGSARSVGLTTEKGFQVSRHDSEGSFRDRTRRTSVIWRPDAPLPELVAEPESDLTEVTPVPEDATAGTADPFTVLLSTLNRLEQGERCDAEARVWDGRRLYDLKIGHIGRAELVRDRPWTYNGTAIGCSLTYTPIGGFRKDSEWRDRQDEIRRIIWIGRLPNEKMVPVRIELSAPIGRFVGRLYTQ